MHDGAGDGRLVVLPGLEVSAAVGVDEVSEATVAGVDVRATPPAAENVVAGVELDALRGGWDDRGGGIGSVGGGGRIIDAVVVASGGCVVTHNAFSAHSGRKRVADLVVGYLVFIKAFHGAHGNVVTEHNNFFALCVVEK